MPMPQLELKIPPPLVAALTAGAMYGVAERLPVLVLSPSFRAGPALALAVLRASFDVPVRLAFGRPKTTAPMGRPFRAAIQFVLFPGRRSFLAFPWAGLSQAVGLKAAAHDLNSGSEFRANPPQCSGKGAKDR